MRTISAEEINHCYKLCRTVDDLPFPCAINTVYPFAFLRLHISAISYGLLGIFKKKISLKKRGELFTIFVQSTLKYVNSLIYSTSFLCNLFKTEPRYISHTWAVRISDLLTSDCCIPILTSISAAMNLLTESIQLNQVISFRQKHHIQSLCYLAQMLDQPIDSESYQILKKAFMTRNLLIEQCDLSHSRMTTEERERLSRLFQAETPYAHWNDEERRCLQQLIPETKNILLLSSYESLKQEYSLSPSDHQIIDLVSFLHEELTIKLFGQFEAPLKIQELLEEENRTKQHMTASLMIKEEVEQEEIQSPQEFMHIMQEIDVQTKKKAVVHLLGIVEALLMITFSVVLLGEGEDSTAWWTWAISLLLIFVVDYTRNAVFLDQLMQSPTASFSRHMLIPPIIRSVFSGLSNIFCPPSRI